MSRKSAIWGLIISVLSAGVVAGIVRIPAGADGGDDHGNNPPVVLTAEGCDPAAIITAALLEQGFSTGQFVVGEANVNWDASEANERGGGAFGSAAKSTQEWVGWLGSDEDAAQEAQAFYAQQAGVTEEQILVPAFWVPFQLTVDSVWEGNTQYSGGEVDEAGTRHSQAGDVGWFFVNPSDCQKVSAGEMPATDAKGAWGRGGCKNPQNVPPKPKVPKAPPTTPPTVPPTVPPTTPPTTRPPCPPPSGVPPEFWDFELCKKKDTSFDYQQNQSQARQDPQNNTTSGVNTGPTPGAPAAPYVPPPGPAPQPSSPAPPPVQGGYDSGSPTGGGTPGGSTTDSGGTTGGGPTPPSGPPVPADGGTYDGDPGGF